jgi:hypothetical protein
VYYFEVIAVRLYARLMQGPLEQLKAAEIASTRSALSTSEFRPCKSAVLACYCQKRTCSGSNVLALRVLAEHDVKRAELRRQRLESQKTARSYCCKFDLTLILWSWLLSRGLYRLLSATSENAQVPTPEWGGSVFVQTVILDRLKVLSPRQYLEF